MNPRKLLRKAPHSPKDLPFHDFPAPARAFGFEVVRISGSHPILGHPDLDEPLNLQEVDGQAKPYQVRQFLRVVEANNLELES
jgi:hypothetical protein